MKYQPMFDIWGIPEGLLPKIQPGQMVYAGAKDNRGRFLGVKKSGTVVVAWMGNVARQASKRGYLRTLRDYALGR